MTAYQRHQGIPSDASSRAEQQRLQAMKDSVDTRLGELKAREAALDQQIASGGKSAGALQAQRKQIGAALAGTPR
jgi:uncharacterized protein (DUF3084 family)